MKKTKQISLVRTLIAAVLLLAGSSGGVAWGQSYIGPPGNNINGSATNPGNIYQAVNNQFGAGESAEIGDGANANDGGQITWPHGNYNVNTGVSTILIGGGGNTPGGGKKNIVINSYNANGDIQGWIRRSWGKKLDIVRGPWHCNSQIADAPSFNYLYDYDSNVDYLNGDIFYNHGYGHDSVGWRSSPEVYTADPCPLNASVVPRTDPAPLRKHSRYQKFIPYVANTNGPDDGTPLLQLIGNRVHTEPTYNSESPQKARSLSSNNLTLYKRPTTVAIQGKIDFDEFKITDLKWWYKTFNVNWYRVNQNETTIQNQDWCQDFEQSATKDCDWNSVTNKYDSYSYRHRKAWTTVAAKFLDNDGLLRIMRVIHTSTLPFRLWPGRIFVCAAV